MNENDCQEILSFLLTGSRNCIPKTYLNLRSYLNLNSANLAAYCGFKLPKFLTNKNNSCSYCFSPWELNNCKFKLLPSSGKKFKSNPDQFKGVNDNKLLSNWNSRQFHFRNKLVLKCQLCLRKSYFSLIKPKYDLNEIQEDKEMKEKTKSKRKKKKKNNCANLNVKECRKAGFKLNSTKIENRKKKNNQGFVDENLNKNSSSPGARSYHLPKNVESTVIKEKSKVNSKENKVFLPNPFFSQKSKANMNENRKRLRALKKSVAEGKKEVVKNSIKSLLNLVQ